MRTLIIDGREWQVRIGKSVLVATSGQGSRKVRLNLPLDRVAGCPWSVIEDEQDDHRFEVTPSMAAAAIRAHCREEKRP